MRLKFSFFEVVVHSSLDTSDKMGTILIELILQERGIVRSRALTSSPPVQWAWPKPRTQKQLFPVKDRLLNIAQNRLALIGCRF